MNRPCEQLDAYIDGILAQDAAVDFEAHLAACPACGAELRMQRELERLLKLAKDHPEPAPASLRLRIKHDLDAAAERSGRRIRILRYAPLAAAAALLLGVTLMWAQRTLPTQRAATERAPAPPWGAVRTAATPMPTPEEALAQLAVLATARDSPENGPALAWLASPAFPQAATVVGPHPAPSAKARRAAKPKAEEKGRDAGQDGPKTGRFSIFSAASIDSVQTLGERKLNQTVIQPSATLKKEDIPC